jgi:REP-associated tyrosine transposase
MYHVTSRGNHRHLLYLCDRDRWKFLALLEKVVKRYDWHVLAYCLMSNHYHLLVSTPEPNISPGMCYLNGVYARRFNKDHFLEGHLFERRFRSVEINDEQFALDAARYIALNPVRAGLVRRPEAWQWSSYPINLGHAPTLDLLDDRWFPSQFRSAAELSQFVDSDLHRIPVPGQAALDIANPYAD